MRLTNVCSKIFCLALATFFLLLIPSGQMALAVGEQLEVSFIDVGQGDSILVEFPNGEAMLVDAGPTDQGHAVVRYLQSQHVSRIDILVATHPHEDHIGGMLDVMDAFRIGKIWDSGYNHGSATQEWFLQAVQAEGIRFGTPSAGFTEDIGEVHIEVLAPVREFLSGAESDANNNSVVLRLSYHDVSFLLTGDMQSEERATVRNWPESTVLKVAHHGSRNGTDLAFLRAVAPEVAIVSYGADNSYGHPAPETRDALRAIVCIIKSTASNGTVTVTTDGYTYTITTSGGSMSPSGSAVIPPHGSGGGPEAYYIGNRNSHIFHRPSCSSLPHAENRVYFDTRDQALAAGYQPCRRCNP